MMKNKILYLSHTLLLAVYACGHSPNDMQVPMADKVMVAPAREQTEHESLGRKLVKEGYIEFETADLQASRKMTCEAVERYNGYISSDQEYKSPGRKSNTLVIRVPAEKFDSLVQDATRGVEKFMSRQIDVKDVTEEYLDIEARLKTKKALEKRYVELLGQANKVSEILEIEREMGGLRSEIESIEGRLKYLQDRVLVSTLTITFFENIPDRTEFGPKFRNGLRNGWDNLIWFFVVLTNIWPFILMVLGLVAGIRAYRKRN